MQPFLIYRRKKTAKKVLLKLIAKKLYVLNTHAHNTYLFYANEKTSNAKTKASNLVANPVMHHI